MINDKNIVSKKPELFEKTTCNIWTDPYIRQQMLTEHLNPKSDGASRKSESIKKITDFIIANSKPGGRLLDLGCGPGLYTSTFADKGYTITGIDFNETSIEYAEKQRNDIHYITGDYIKDYPQGKFDIVIIIYCDLGTHSDIERDILLHNIYNSLNEGGVFIFDVFTEALIKDKHESKSWEYTPNGGFWDENKYLILSETFHYPKNKAFAYQYNLLTEKENKHFIVWDRYYNEDEICKILKDTGFHKATIHKDILDNNNFTSESEMFIVAQKKEA